MDNNPTQSTRQCPYCGEDIQPGAIKCKHCNEWLVNNPPPTPKSPEERAKELEKQEEKKQEKKMATGCLIASLIVPVLIIGMLLFIASISVPDLEEHREEIRESAVECAEDQAGDILGLLGGTALKPLLSLAMNTETAQRAVLENFDKLNKIEYVPGTFWSKARIVNRIYPKGKNVSFGILGMVFSSLDWEDFVLLEDDKEATKSSGSSSSSSPSVQQDESSNGGSLQTAPSANASHQAYHGQIQGNIRCEFDLYFEPAAEGQQQEVRGSYNYPKQGGRPITVHGWYDPATGDLSLTEYYDDGTPNASMRVSRTEEGFQGWFIRPGKSDLTLIMTE